MSGSSSNIALTISARDLASAQIANVNKQIAKLQTPSERAAEGIGKLTDPARMGKLSAGMRNVSRDSLSAFENIGRIVGPLGIITSAASIAGLAALSREWARMGNQMGNSAQRAGVGVTQLSNFQNAAKLSGASAQSATAGMTSLNDAITNAAAGRSPQAVMAFNQLGISLRDSTGHLRTAADLLPEVAHGLASIKNPTIQHDLGNMLFGGSADELMPLFRRFDELSQKAAKTGADWTPKMAADAAKLNEAWSRFGEDFSGITNRIEDDWSGMITKVLTGTSDWIERNQALADSNAKIVASITALGAIKLSAPLLRMLGLGGLADAALPIAVTAAGVIATGKNGQNSATAQDEAAKQGYTQVAGIDGDGMPTAFKNPTTGDTKSAAQFDQRYNPSLTKQPWLGEGNDTPPTPRPSPPAADVQMDPTKRAFLDTLAGPESQGQYNIKNGWSRTNDNSQTRFSDYSKFPEGIAPGGTSTAAGRYQFISSTWADEQKRLGLPDFSPGSQDKAAWDLAATRYRSQTGEDLEVALRSGNKNTRIAQVLGPIWPSLPGGSQSNQSQIQFDHALAANMGIESAGAPAAPGIQGGSGAPPATSNDTTVKGAADLKITLNGFPTGTSTNASTTGDLFGGPPKVVQAMPLGMQP